MLCITKYSLYALYTLYAIQVMERQERIDSFNSDPSIFAFLLSTRAGGLGINLVCALHVYALVFICSNTPPYLACIYAYMELMHAYQCTFLCCFYTSHIYTSHRRLQTRVYYLIATGTLTKTHKHRH